MRSENVKRVRKCLSGLLATQPFFGDLALRMPLVPDAKRKTIACDGERLYFNPGWIADNTADDIRAGMARCVFACALKHHTRRGKRNYQRWQEASRQVTIPMMLEAGLADKDATGEGMDMSVEDAYELIPEPEDDENGEGEGDPKAQGGGGAGMAVAGAGGSGDGEQDGDSAPESAPDGGGDSGAGNAGQDAKDAQQPSHDPHGAGEVMDSPATTTGSRSDVERAEQEMDEALFQAAQTAKAAGKAPGKIRELIDASHVHPVAWEDLLQQFMQDAAKNDYSWSRPNRRFIHQGLYLPALYSEGMGPLVFCIDTSASMDTSALAAVWAQLRIACDEVRPTSVTVIQCDTHVRHVDTYDPNDLPESLDAHGRGGTAFGPAISAMLDLEFTPAVGIYFTDGHTWESEPPAIPDFPMMWAITDNGPWNPWFGEKIEIET